MPEETLRLWPEYHSFASESEDFYDNMERVEQDVDRIPDSDTREEDLATIIDYKTFKEEKK